MMKSAVHEILPTGVRRSLDKFGHDLGVARRRRRLTVASMVERLGVAKATYLRAERGDPRVALGVYAMALFVLGFGDVWADIADAGKDEHGLLLEEERLPKRVRAGVKPKAW